MLVDILEVAKDSGGYWICCKCLESSSSGYVLCVGYAGGLEVLDMLNLLDSEKFSMPL